MVNRQLCLALIPVFAMTAGAFEYKSGPYSLTGNTVTDGARTATALSRDKIESSFYDKSRIRELSKDISAFPELICDDLMITALYRMALEEALLDVRKDNTFMAGKIWDGVWTRDISYSIHLALAEIMPQVAINSLKAKVSNSGTIIQDTGTGGSWPVSSDRMVWAAAAWQIYLSTGDVDFLKYAYAVISKSAEDDLRLIWNPELSLMHGESSFMDWREQSYPKWMDPVDIFNTYTLSANVVHAHAYDILSRMAAVLGTDGSRWKKQGESIKNGIEKNLMVASKQYHASYVFDAPGLILSDKSDTLGEALGIIWGVTPANTARNAIRNYPQVNYGVPCIYPQQPHAGPYHNKGIWPFVQAYFNLAAAQTGNQESLIHGFAAMTRAGLLFLTHKENFVYDTGNQATAVNSDRQLWSVSGYLAMIYKVFFGVRLEPDGIHFQPVLPSAIHGPITLKNYRYRKAVLSITVSGNGNEIAGFSINGKAVDKSYVLPAAASGLYNIEIVLREGKTEPGLTIKTGAMVSPDTVGRPELADEGKSIKLSWNKSKDAVRYHIYRDSDEIGATESADFLDEAPPRSVPLMYYVRSENQAGLLSTESPPVYFIPAGHETVITVSGPGVTVEGGTMKEAGGRHFIENLSKPGSFVSWVVETPVDGNYLVQFKYANGEGPIHTLNKCGLRTLTVNNAPAARIVLPQQGSWQVWKSSSFARVALRKGKNTLVLLYDPLDVNMSGKVNNIAVESIRLIRY